MLEKVLPHAMLKAKPNLESRIRILKRYWAISHKEVDKFRHRSFSYYDQLTAIYAKDPTARKDAQTAANIIEEIDVENVATTNTHEERNDFHGCEADVSLGDMDLSATQSQPPRNQGDSTFSKKKKRFFIRVIIFLLLHLLMLQLYWRKTYRLLALKSIGAFLLKC
ncbi:hypothetical protein Gogos_004509 [Gossypium gossypioides]|uniref:Uncharacterized protein n=1 Tax=Gossypium gossypioides TaxID=34282 RepID=A0A7J9CH16_GOSGO|nr:hypothetical protein [Gossypium gossypioides]